MKKRCTRLIAMFLALVMALSLAACGKDDVGGDNPVQSNNGNNSSNSNNGSNIQVDEKGESTLYMNITSDPQGFDLWAGSGSFQLNYSIFETLFVNDYNGGYIPNPHLFKSCELSEDRMGMTFTLYDDILTHDGTKLVAQDIIWSLEMMMTTNKARFAKVFDLEKSKVIDDTNLYLASKGKWVDYNYNSVSMISVASQSSYESSSDHHYFTGLCGTGPYMVESYTEGNEVVLVKSPNYDNRGSDQWGGQNVDRIVCKVISEASQKTIEYETGAIDFIVDPELNDLNYLESLDNTAIFGEAQNKNIAICFNCSESSIFNDVRIRQAVAYAIDTKAICEQALEGRKITATGVTNPVCETWDDSMYNREYYSVNVDKAKDLLKQAGYPNGIEIELSYSESISGGGAYIKTMAEIIQNQLSKAGITLTLTPYDSATLESIAGTEDGWEMRITTYAIQMDAMFHFWNLCNANKKDEAFWNNSEFQTILDDTLYTRDAAGIEKLVDIYEEECPYYVLAYNTTYFVARADIENVRFKGNNWYFPGDWDFSNAEWAYE